MKINIVILATIILHGSTLSASADSALCQDPPCVQAADSEETGDLREAENLADADLSVENKADLLEKLILAAKELVGIPYRFGGDTLRGIDCSAYVKRVFAALDIELPRSVKEQFLVGRDVPKEELAPGDMVFFKTYAKYPSHVGIFIGDNKFIHASSKGKGVSISNFDKPYYLKRFIGAKRLDL